MIVADCAAPTTDDQSSLDGGPLPLFSIRLTLRGSVAGVTLMILEPHMKMMLTMTDKLVSIDDINQYNDCQFQLDQWISLLAIHTPA